MLDQVNLADIRSFVLIAQKGNFTKAAEALDVSRSHVSRQISQLEKHMGVTLFIRTTRTLRLTDAGRTFFLQCEKALHDIDQALLSAVDEVEVARGEVRVNCVGGYLGEEVIAEIASQFMQQHPEVTVHLDFSSHRVDLIDEHFDVAFRMGKLEDAGFIARKLMDIQMSTLASPNYIERNGKPNHPKDLVQHQCLTGSVKRWSFQHATSSSHYDLTVSGPLQCKNGRVLVKGAVNGNGIIRVPYLYCSSEVEKGLLVEVFDDWGIPSVDFSMVYHRDKFQPKRIRAFIDFVQGQFARQSG
ncbi:LysR family transcriptional regulator [Vibrio agarivorans]|uniref:LysR family transcriptional regulator n=1 Tax=Vibrio agarivorans TaxID=153622 RepID=A0ABT7Y595_9VIBR|nr:LysR family transcriptional regulator [Vibrio agarivorans]MDN2482914.1 LysR family transcriptional regulator [Vibrio agarivorans]